MDKEKQKEYVRKWRKEHKEQIRKSRRKWRRENKEKCRKGLRKYREVLKKEVFTYYSNGIPKCAVCNFCDIRALTIDHINDDGAKHRRALSKKSRGNQAGGSKTYQYLRSKKYPSGYQVLCANCNLIKEHERRKRERL